MVMEDTLRQVKRAYKKLKANIYYDKTQIVLRNQLVKYEADDNQTFIDSLEEIATRLESNEENWKEFKKKILDSIDVLAFPKSILGTSDQNNGLEIITNFANDVVNIKDVQNFIKIAIPGQILGILWVLKIGKKIDDDVYEHSYGNRLRESFMKENEGYTDLSPNLFKPYFSQYESWRDIALDYAQKKMKNHEDVLILTLDIKKYYYSVDFSENVCESLKNDYNEIITENKINERIHDFVIDVLKVYSKKFDNINSNTILPIGFIPSNILSNWYLGTFDDAIINRWNPVYYGRYVDDIIIVDKVKKNSELYKKIESSNEPIKQSEAIKYFLCNCNADKNNLCDKNNQLLHTNKQGDYSINLQFINRDGDLRVQNDKVKLFYFKENHTDSMITCFRNEIAKNKSEFRFMPDDENIIKNDDYSEIYNLVNEETLNKFRGVKGISVDKYALSKFLGKTLSIGSLIKDRTEAKFERDIELIFDNETIISNYTLWERILEISVINGHFNTTTKFIIQIIDAIEKCVLETHEKNGDRNKKILKDSLLQRLFSSISRSFSLCWGNNVKEVLDNIEKEIRMKFDLDISFSEANITQFRKYYCLSRMLDKDVMPIAIDCFLGRNEISDEKFNVNLTDFHNCFEKATNLKWDKIEYFLYPYMVSPQDLEHTLALSYIKEARNINFHDLYKKSDELFHGLNFNSQKFDVIKDKPQIKRAASGSLNADIIKISNKKMRKMKVAVANTRIQEKDFIGVLTGNPNRKYERYKNVMQIINEAIRCKADLLVMPESFVPYEWLNKISRVCAKSKMAVVTGVEHLVVNRVEPLVNKKNVFNLTATILPNDAEEHKFSHVFLHNKVHFSPNEERLIKGYGLNTFEGDSYELYCWNDVWFSVYCCFELASIKDRSIFQSYADMTVAVEWNRDTNYYSNIIESLDRDLHCYCVQVNTAEYGDSRITKPSSSNIKDIIRTKGGENPTVLVGEIDIEALRDFQIKGFELQKDDRSFKPTPPDFDSEKTKLKIRGRLFENIE